MLHSGSHVFSRQLLFRVLDPLVLLGTLLLATWVRLGALPDADHWKIIAVLLVAAVVVFQACGSYGALTGYRLSQWCRRPLWALCILTGGALAAAYAMKTSSELSRAIAVGSFVGSAALLVASRVIAHRFAIVRYREGRWVEQVIICGAAQYSLSFARHLKRHPELGLRAAAIVSDELESKKDYDQSALINHDVRDLPRLVEEHRATRVIICGALGDQRLILEVVRMLMDRAVIIQYAPDYSSVPIFIFRADDCAGRPVIDLSDSPFDDTARTIKWFEDKLLSSLIILCAAPVMLVVALLVKLTSPGPVFFLQDRHGLGGRPFRVYKFRTMRHDHAKSPAPPAEEEETEDDSDAFEALVGIESKNRPALEAKPDAFVQATHGDPRITPIGKFLRNTSLDELPQFLNVLRGDMSIVGPRPHAVAHNARYLPSIGELMRRHYVKPGITGLAQISGARGETRNTQQMRNRIRYDLEYIHNWSLWLDLKIIVLTVFKGFINKQP